MLINHLVHYVVKLKLHTGPVFMFIDVNITENIAGCISFEFVTFLQEAGDFTLLSHSMHVTLDITSSVVRCRCFMISMIYWSNTGL